MGQRIAARNKSARFWCAERAFRLFDRSRFDLVATYSAGRFNVIEARPV
jgi:hypothetical protein